MPFGGGRPQSAWPLSRADAAAAGAYVPLDILRLKVM